MRSEPEKAVTEFNKPKKSTGDALILPGFYYPSEQVISFSSIEAFETVIIKYKSIFSIDLHYLDNVS